MYRAFDLSIVDAALGTIQNSTIMKYGEAARDAAKTAVMENLFSYLKYGTATPENAFAQLIQQIVKTESIPACFWTVRYPAAYASTESCTIKSWNGTNMKTLPSLWILPRISWTGWYQPFREI